MIQKGIIEKVNNDLTYKVRIPLYHKIKGAVNSTATEDLPSAILNTTAGVKPNLQTGDVVLVGFENELLEKPVILGLLYTENIESNISYIDTDNLTVNGITKLGQTNIDGSIDIGNNSTNYELNLNGKPVGNSITISLIR